MTRPRILISTATGLRLEGLRRRDAIGGLNYAEAVSRLGGLPTFLPNLEPELAEAYLEGADGLILAGGADADPKHFQQEPHPQLGLVDPERDAFEFALYRAAKARGLPVLGICRGIQMINVAEGGSLHQHLPAVPSTIQHEQRNIDGSLSHQVSLAPGSSLARTFGAEAVRVNSYHHQAVDRPGAGLEPIAWSSDGIVEALEGSGAQFVLGVQWHPEMSFARYPEQLAPFQLFIEAARRRRGAARAA